MIKINHSDVLVRLLNDNCTSLYNQYSLEFPAQEVSYSTFKRCMPKNFKKSKKETNLCGHCENGKAAISELFCKNCKIVFSCFRFFVCDSF